MCEFVFDLLVDNDVIPLTSDPGLPDGKLVEILLGVDDVNIRGFIVTTAIVAVALGAAPQAAAQPFKNCTAARDAGYTNIPSTSEFYGPHLDRDQDGIGCES